MTWATLSEAIRDGESVKNVANGFQLRTITKLVLTAPENKCGGELVRLVCYENAMSEEQQRENLPARLVRCWMIAVLRCEMANRFRVTLIR